MVKQEFPKTISGQRILLRKHTLDVAPTMFSYVDRDRERLRQFLPWVDSTKSVEDEINYVKMTHEYWDKGELFDYGVFDRTSNIYMGNVGVHNIIWGHECCEFGYWILGDFEGKGFMSDAVKTLEGVCFERGFNRIEIRCSSLNTRSASVPIRLGYRLEGVLSQNAIELGRHRDTLVFGKLKGEFDSQPKPALLGLAHVYIFVEDMAKSAQWFESALGVAPSEKMENFVLFRLGQSELCLHPADTKSPFSTGGSVGYWRTPEVKTTVAHFERHGAILYRGPLAIGNGQAICQMRDPNGNIIGLIGASA